jgi:hypothetical protein
LEDWVPAVEDTTAACDEQRLENWVPVVEDTSTIPSTTVPVWKRLTAAELEVMAGGDESLLAELAASAARDHGPTDSFCGVLGRGRMGGDYLE